MDVRITTLRGQDIPKYQTAGAVGFDIQSADRTVIAAKSLGLIPTGLIIEVPDGYCLQLCARSSTPKKKGLLIPHGVGIIDQDYCGPEDELFVQYYNFTDEDVVVEAGERCAQGVFVRVEQAEFEVVDSITDTSRGGFGSTGK